MYPQVPSVPVPGLSVGRGFLFSVSVDAPVAPPAQYWLRESLRRFFARPRLVVALFVAPVVILLVGVVSWVIDWRLGVDSAVYRSGAVALLTGEPLYDNMFLSAEPPWARLPFTYPPTGTLLFVPLALFPTQVSWGLLGVVSVPGARAGRPGRHPERPEPTRLDDTRQDDGHRHGRWRWGSNPSGGRSSSGRST